MNTLTLITITVIALIVLALIVLNVVPAGIVLVHLVIRRVRVTFPDRQIEKRFETYIRVPDL